jgi:menaquinone-9 beta-reductase
MKPVTIIGGGLAGLGLGILLRRENIPVTLHEAGRYPRHRVCGEFLSGEGRRILRDIAPASLPTTEAATATIFLGDRPPLYLHLPEPALCCSRYELDSLLAHQFQDFGGTVQTNSRFTNHEVPGLIHASGRRRADPRQGHLFGLKAHATNIPLTADLELHFASNRYVGICRIFENRANVCGLFYSGNPICDIQNRWPEILSQSIPSLARANWMPETFCAVAGISLDQHYDHERFAIGDAAAMIPPLTGNGMSMALESAALAAPSVVAYSLGKISWREAVAQHHAKWTAAFTRRLRWANFTQRLAFFSGSQRLLFSIAKIIPALPNLVVSRTR